MLGQQDIATPHIDCDGIVRHEALEFHREYGEGFVEAERGPEVLAEFEEGLRFLPRRGNGSKESSLFVFRAGFDKAGSWRCPAFHFQVSREFRPLD